MVRDGQTDLGEREEFESKGRLVIKIFTLKMCQRFNHSFPNSKGRGKSNPTLSYLRSRVVVDYPGNQILQGSQKLVLPGEHDRFPVG